MMIAIVATLSVTHSAYLALSRAIPTEDEVHYMTGAIGISNGIRSGTAAGAWDGFQNALGFKAPLICVPAAILMLLSHGTMLACMLSLVPTFAALGFVGFRLFRRCVGDWRALAATTILLSMPMITGLAHNFYVELLLVTVSVWYLDLLAARPWQRIGGAAALGLAAGLGVLTKSSFPALVALPTLFSLSVDFLAEPSQRSRRVWIAARNLAIAVTIAILVAGPWYARNFASVLSHVEAALSSQSFYYSAWIRGYLSAGPGSIVALAGLAALAFVVRDLITRRINGPRAEALVLVLLLGLATAVAVAGTANKATRFVVTALPAFALLSVMLFDHFRRPWLKRYGPVLLAACSVVLSLHNSFAILPLPPIRVAAMTLLDSSFPLNSAGYYDNHPLDRRDFHIDRIDDAIAADAAKRFAPGQLIRVRLASDGLISNFYYFQVVDRLNQRAFDYAEWRGTETSGPEAPEYIVAYEGFGRIYPMEDHYPALRGDVTTGRIAYSEAVTIDAPEDTRIRIYAKKMAEGAVPKLSLAAMTRSANPPVYNLENLAGIASPLGKTGPLQIRANSSLKLDGWAVDDEAKALAAGVEVVIDGKAYRALYGRSRPDVAAYFHVPAYLNAGFSASVPMAAVGPGQHKLALRVIAQDRKSYSEGATIELDVR